MSTLGTIHVNRDDGEEEVTSRPPLRDRSHTVPVVKSKTSKQDLLELLVKFNLEAESKKTELQVLKKMR
jgi:hypothetical protein